MEKRFILDSIVLCDFGTQDNNGKQVHVGVYGDVVYFNGGIPPFYPPMSIVLSVQPLAKEIDFILEYFGPQMKGILRGDISVSLERDPPKDHQISINFNIPAIPSLGEGTYIIIVKNKTGNIVGKKEMDFRASDTSKNFIPIKVKVDAAINSELMAQEN